MNGVGKHEVVQVDEVIEDHFEENGELADEIADTATIEQLLDGYIQEVNEMFTDAFDVSLEGNPVRTHIELLNLGQDIVNLAHTLKRELLDRVANRAEIIAEQGSQLRKQVFDDEQDGKGI